MRRRLILSTAFSSLLIAAGTTSARPHFREQVGVGLTIACAAFSQAETARLGFRHAHLFACADVQGEVSGALLSPKGIARCGVTGVYDASTQCGTLIVCGRTIPICL